MEQYGNYADDRQDGLDLVGDAARRLAQGSVANWRNLGNRIVVPRFDMRR